MPAINLNNCFPAAEDGSRSPLPKQAEFLQKATDPKGPKYIGYVGGIGSGKTLVGSITVLSWAVMYPGDYLIGREYYPELKDTTYKTFLEICPPELIKEIRVADMIIKIKAVGGKTSTIFFRPLDEYNKLRSLNLSGFMIDEGSQVQEEAFMLLQGRLRGPGLRKGIVVGNPAGHNWIYHWWVKQDFMAPEVRKNYNLITAFSTENTHLPDGYVADILATWSKERIQREIYASFDAFEGQVFNEFRRDVHVIQPFAIPDSWHRIIGIDHGYRNPAAWIWGAIDHDGDIYIYREFYESELLIEEIIKGKPGRTKGVKEMMKGEKISAAFIDPSVNQVRGTKGEVYYAEYLAHLPKNFPLILANNNVDPGIEKVKSYMKVREDINKPRLFIFNTCSNLIDEIVKYKFKELRPSQEGKQNLKETPTKVDDHACDALRYLVMSRPDPSPKVEAKNTKRTAEYYLRKHIQGIKKPKAKDPFQDF